MLLSSSDVPTTAVLSSGLRSGPLLPARLSHSGGGMSGGSPAYRKRKKRAPKPPKESRVRRAVVAAIALRAQGFGYKEAAEQLGLTLGTIKTYMRDARRKGWIDERAFVDPADKVEMVLTGMAVDNLSTILNETKEMSEKVTSLSDRAVDTSLEVAKGVGLLKTHSAIKTDNTNQMGLALKVDVVMPAGGLPTVRDGSVGGQPFFDA